MKKKNFRSAKATALKIVEGLNAKNIIIEKYIIYAFDKGFLFTSLSPFQFFFIIISLIIFFIFIRIKLSRINCNKRGFIQGCITESSKESL